MYETHKMAKFIFIGMCFGLALTLVLLNWDRISAITKEARIDTSRHSATKELKVQTPTWSWTEVFAYVPNAIEECLDLFPDAKYLPDDFRTEFDEYFQRVKSVAGSEKIEGFSAQFLEESMVYVKSVQAPFVRTVCETGFNAGHSSFLWLAANPDTRVYSFDIGRHNYSRHMAEHLQQRFPGRLKVTWGDSTDTLPRFQRQNPGVKCDLVIVDGGHTYDICKSDFDTFQKMASPDNIVILDNYPDSRGGFVHTLGRVWEEGKKMGDILEIFRCRYHDRGQGFSVGRILTK